MLQQQEIIKKEVQDIGISQRAIQAARVLDRLPAGEYMVRVVKPDMEAASWRFEVDRLDHVQKYAFTKYLPE